MQFILSSLSLVSTVARQNCFRFVGWWSTSYEPKKLAPLVPFLISPVSWVTALQVKEVSTTELALIDGLRGRLTKLDFLGRDGDWQWFWSRLDRTALQSLSVTAWCEWAPPGPIDFASTCKNLRSLHLSLSGPEKQAEVLGHFRAGVWPRLRRLRLKCAYYDHRYILLQQLKEDIVARTKLDPPPVPLHQLVVDWSVLFRALEGMIAPDSDWNTAIQEILGLDWTVVKLERVGVLKEVEECIELRRGPARLDAIYDFFFKKHPQPELEQSVLSRVVGSFGLQLTRSRALDGLLPIFGWVRARLSKFFYWKNVAAWTGGLEALQTHAILLSQGSPSAYASEVKAWQEIIKQSTDDQLLL